MHHNYIDRYSDGNTIIHSIDARVKILSAILFSIVVVGLPRYSIAPLIWFMIGPFTIFILAKIPFKFVISRIVIAAPFIVALAVCYSFIDSESRQVNFGPWQMQIRESLLICANIIIKFTLTMSALTALTATTPFSSLLCGLEKLYVPRLLILQLAILYRYIFLLIDIVGRYLRSYSARSLRYLGFKREMTIRSAMIGSILISSLDISERVNLAMMARGFDGKIHALSQEKIRGRDFLFAAIVCMYLVVLKVILW